METNERTILLLKKFVCLICFRDFSDKKHKQTARYCSRICANTGVSRSTAEKRAAKMRGSGEKNSYIKYFGKHQHRVAMEDALGRKLNSDEIVHHIDHDRTNNDILNLTVMKQSDHAFLHSSKSRICEIINCDRKHCAKGKCSRHYANERYKNGN